MEAKKLFFMNCHLAGKMYHDADEVWDDLKVGTILRLELDKDNRHDANAVAVIYDQKNKKGEIVDEFCIGYIPRDKNERIVNFLEMGWTNVFECRINKIAPDAHPEHQIQMTIKIKRNTSCQTEE